MYALVRDIWEGSGALESCHFNLLGEATCRRPNSIETLFEDLGHILMSPANHWKGHKKLDICSSSCLLSVSIMHTKSSWGQTRGKVDKVISALTKCKSSFSPFVLLCLQNFGCPINSTLPCLSQMGVQSEFSPFPDSSRFYIRSI